MENNRENSKEQTIDEYIAQCPSEIQSKLHELRKIIKEAEPELKEKFSWQMPTFYLKGNIIHFAANKKHIGIYPGAGAIEHFSDRLEEYKCSKGAIQIPYSKALDEKLITDLVKFNVNQQKNNIRVL